MDFNKRLTHLIAMVDEHLDRVMPKDTSYAQIISEAMRYSLFAGGKRLRPILTLACCDVVGGKLEEALPYAGAIEMLHTYSLIHDDLPAMDNDDYRRGKPTNHKKFGENIAILAGDGLLNYAFEHMTEEALKSKDIHRSLLAINAIATSTGVFGMIGGQVVDVIKEGSTIDADTLDFIHNNKTGALIKSSVKAGAIVGGANEEQIAALVNYGHCIGLAFQIMDDVLDIIGDKSKMGKTIGKDAQSNKTTYPTLLGIEKSVALVNNLTKEAIESLDIFDDKKQFLIDLAKYLVTREF